MPASYSRSLSLLNPPLGRGHYGVNRVHSDLSAEAWVFWYFEDKHALVLDTYQRLSRPTRRHGWKVDEAYNRLARRGDYNNLENPPLPEDVKHEAAWVWSTSVRVGKWEEVTR